MTHRDPSSNPPEHTLEGYRMRARMGDDIELDLVTSGDGVLIARDEPELGATTDVGDRPEFAARRATKTVDGVRVTGWFVEDFNLAEIKSLTARARIAGLRPESAAYDGQLGVPTFNEILAMVHAESIRGGRTIGVAIMLKHASYFDGLGLPLDVPLLSDLRRHELDHPRSRVTVTASEPDVLRRLAGRTKVSVVQPVGRVSASAGATRR